MIKLPLLTWIGNAAAALCGKHGDVTGQAQEAGCSRQTVYDHAEKVHKALEDAQLPGPSREQLLREVEELKVENRQLWDWLKEALEPPTDKQRHFATTACAMGLSLTQTLVLLALFLPARALPSRATLGRWVQQDARKAGRVLTILDKACRALVLSLCLDEIFLHRKPVLMGVEPHSMAWILGQRAKDRTGATWANAIAAWPNLQDAAVDGGSGLEKGLGMAFAQRQEEAAKNPDGKKAVPLRVQLDVFHIRRDGNRALRRRWQYAQKLWDKAQQLEKAKERFDRAEVGARKVSTAKVKKAWAKALAEFDKVCKEEAAWERACAALRVFRPDGQLNDRHWAEGELAKVVEELPGTLWAKVRRQLQDKRTLVFLDRMHEELEKVEANPERRAALVALWRWRRETRKEAEQGQPSAARVMGEVLQGVVARLLGEGWRESYKQVSEVLARVQRASSAVECVNSIVRMHQARHRNLTQELLDLKRLFFNCRDFTEGKRKGRCPYELLGLQLPSFDPWILLNINPVQLEQIMSSQQLAA